MSSPEQNTDTKHLDQSSSNYHIQMNNAFHQWIAIRAGQHGQHIFLLRHQLYDAFEAGVNYAANILQEGRR